MESACPIAPDVLRWPLFAEQFYLGPFILCNTWVFWSLDLHLHLFPVDLTGLLQLLRYSQARVVLSWSEINNLQTNHPSCVDLMHLPFPAWHGAKFYMGTVLESFISWDELFGSLFFINGSGCNKSINGSGSTDHLECSRQKNPACFNQE